MSLVPGPIVRTLLLIVALSCTEHLAAAAGPLEIDPARVAGRANALIEAHGIPGYSVGVVEGENLVYIGSFGVADRESNQPPTADTLFQIGSITKTMTATLAAVLRDEGLINFGDPINRFLPDDVPLHADLKRHPQITLRHLAMHTSGLPRDAVNRRNRPDGPSVMLPMSTAQLYAGLKDTALESRPGARWSYSNLNFALLGHAIERAAHQPLESLMRKRLFSPLGMAATTITLTEPDKKRLAAHYWRQDPDTAQEPYTFGEICGFGGVASNVRDLAKYVAFQFRAGDENAKPLDGRTIRELSSPQLHIREWELAIGLAWFIRHSDEFGSIVSHGGEVDGHSAMIGFSPSYQIGVIVLANMGGPSADRLGRWLMTEALWTARQQRTPSQGDAETYYARREWANAAWAYDSLTRRVPGEAEYHDRLANALGRQGRYAEALREFERAVEMGIQRADAYFNMARCNAMLGDEDAAIEALRNAFDAGLLDTDDVRNDERLLSLRGDSRFVALCDQADDREIVRLRRQAERFYRAQNWRRAADVLRKLAEHQPDDGEVHFRLGYALLAGRSDYLRGAQAFERAVELNYQPVMARYNVACAYALANEKVRALDWLEKALDGGFDDMDLLRRDGDLDAIRNDPRFTRLLEDRRKTEE